MKTFRLNKFLVAGLLFLVTALLVLFGKADEASSFAMATPAAIVLTEEEKKDLTEAEQKFYLGCKKLIAQVKEDIPKNTITKEEAQAIVDAIKKDLGQANTDTSNELKEAIKSLEETLKTQGEVLAELRLKGSGGGSAPSLLQVVKDNAEQLKASTKKGKEHEFEIKADTLRASVVGNQNALDLAGIGQLAHRKLTVYDIFRKVPVPKNNNGVIRYVDWNPATTARAAAAIAEGGAFPSSEAKWQVYTLNLEKVGDSIPMSEEFLYDSELFAAELENFLNVNVAIKIDTDLVAGDGNSPNLNGLKNQLTAYVPAAAGIQDASIYDLIVKLREAITAPYGSKYNPDVALMNITDINKMKLKKDGNNNYVMPPFADKNGNIVDGFKIIECNSFTANTMAVGDSRFGAIYEEPGTTVQTGFATGDFESDMMTIKARKRLNLLIRNVDRTGWLKVTDIDAAITTIAG